MCDFFSGEFGSERLVQRVVDTILRHTAPKVKDQEGASTSVVSPYQDTDWSAEEPSKIILTGHKVQQGKSSQFRESNWT